MADISDTLWAFEACTSTAWLSDLLSSIVLCKARTCELLDQVSLVACSAVARYAVL